MHCTVCVKGLLAPSQGAGVWERVCTRPCALVAAGFLGAAGALPRTLSAKARTLLRDSRLQTLPRGRKAEGNAGGARRAVTRQKHTARPLLAASTGECGPSAAASGHARRCTHPASKHPPERHRAPRNTDPHGGDVLCGRGALPPDALQGLLHAALVPGRHDHLGKGNISVCACTAGMRQSACVLPVPKSLPGGGGGARHSRVLRLTVALRAASALTTSKPMPLLPPAIRNRRGACLAAGWCMPEFGRTPRPLSTRAAGGLRDC